MYPASCAIGIANELDPETRARIDLSNPMRVQRAWEVQAQTGTGIATWQDATPPPLVPLDRALPLQIVSDPDWLNARIETRFERMLASGLFEEARDGAPAEMPTAEEYERLRARYLREREPG